MGITTDEDYRPKALVGAATNETDVMLFLRLRSETECGVFCIKMRLRNVDWVWMKC